MIRLPAYAKINLSLDVLNRRMDGYHEVRMLMQHISICDYITVSKNGGKGVRLTSNSSQIPLDNQNIAYRAARMFLGTFHIVDGVDVHIEKNIPVGAGLAGGSTDAAAVLRGMNQLFETGASLDTLTGMGVRLGADVPFCIYGSPSLAEDIGEQLTPITGLPDMEGFLVNPGFSVSTQQVYQRYDEMPSQTHPDTNALIQALKRGDLEAAFPHMHNVLAPVTIGMHPVIGELLQELQHTPGVRHAMMSGSGPTVFAFTAPDAPVENLLRRYEQQGYFVSPFITRNSHASLQPTISTTL